MNRRELLAALVGLPVAAKVAAAEVAPERLAKLSVNLMRSTKPLAITSAKLFPYQVSMTLDREATSRFFKGLTVERHAKFTNPALGIPFPDGAN